MAAARVAERWRWSSKDYQGPVLSSAFVALRSFANWIGSLCRFSFYFSPLLAFPASSPSTRGQLGDEIPPREEFKLFSFARSDRYPGRDRDS